MSTVRARRDGPQVGSGMRHCPLLWRVIMGMCVMILGGCEDTPPWRVPRADGPLALRVVHPAPGAPRPPGGFDYIAGSAGTGRAKLRINGVDTRVLPNGAFLAYLPVAPGLTAHVVEAVAGTDTTRLLVPITRAAVESIVAEGDSAAGSAAGVPVRLASPDTAGLGDGSVLASDRPDGPRVWSLLPGTEGVVTGRIGTKSRVQIAPGVQVWANTRDVRALLSGGEVASLRPDRAEVVSTAAEVDLVIPASAPPPLRTVETPDGVLLVLYGHSHGIRRGRTTPHDAWVRSVEWRRGPIATTYSVHLSGPLLGYTTLWRNGAVVLRLRRVPGIDSRHPLRGLTIVVDPGHPPGGAVGPTGLREPAATLLIAQRLRSELESRSARVVLTRQGAAQVSLTGRIRTSRSMDAHAFVSIHLDATPPGRDPSTMRGSGTFAFSRSSLPLASAIQERVVHRLGLPDRGVARGDFAVLRPTWAPSVLSEGATLTVPEDEAAVRDPDFQRAYARAIAEGLERYFRDLAERKTFRVATRH